MDTSKEMSDDGDRGEFRSPVGNGSVARNGNAGQDLQLDDFESDLENANNRYDYEESEKHEKVEDGPRWKEYSEDVSKNVLLEKLRDATKKRQEGKLEKALEDCEEAGIEDNDDMYKAEYVLGVIKVQHELLLLLNKDDAKQIEQEFDTIKRNYARYLDDAQWELSQVRQHLWFLKEGIKYRTAYEQRVFSLSPNVISEIRRYMQPTKIVHTIVQAALLLFGENESLTKEWSYCQKRLNPQGSSSLVSRMIDFEVQDVHSEIAARADELLKLLIKDLEANGGSEDNIRASSPSAFTLYVWTQGVIEQRRNLASDQEETWKPARLKPQPSRQLAIFEEQKKALQLKQRQAAQQQKQAAAANSPRSKSPRRNYPNNAGKQTNQKPKVSTK